MPSKYDLCKCGNKKDVRSKECFYCSKVKVKTTKVCKSCDKELSIESFRIRTRKHPKPRSYCRECEANKRREYYHSLPKEIRKSSTRQWEKNNPELHYKQILRKRMRTIGLPEEQIEYLVNRYLNTFHCEICNQHVENCGTLSIDHCHQSGQFRGFVCSKCNFGLGNFCDNVDILRKAIEYLKRERE